MIINGERKLAGVLSFGAANGCGISFTVHARVNYYIEFLRKYALGTPAVIIPELPPPPATGVVDVELPTLPVFTASKPITLPKFSASRTFQLILTGGNKCAIYLDSSSSLRGVRIKIYAGKSASKAISERILDEFGDTQAKSSLSCSELRRIGIFVLRSDSSVKTQAIE